MADYKRFIREAGKFIPKDRIYTDQLRLLAWGTDAGFYRMVPRVVVRSKDETEVSKLLTLASLCGTPVTFRAAGTSLSGQAISDSVLIVAGKNWEKYSLSEDCETITLEPGITGGRVNEILAPYGRRFSPDPASVKSCMVGGIVINNASGMNCGTHANSDRVMVSARMVLPDGTVLDTGSEQSRREFDESHPEFLARICALRDRVRADKTLCERILYKYSIKNVTGLNILPLVRYDDPFDIIAHLLVGSEGTLAFLSRVTMRTEREFPFKASAMLYFRTIQDACRAVIDLKKLALPSPPGGITTASLIQSAEMLDWKSLDSVSDEVFLRYKAEVGEEAATGLTALLTETKANSEKELQRNISTIENALKAFDTYIPVRFTDRPEEYSRYWAVRSGIFPAVGGTRERGTTCMIEDIAFHVEDLPSATAELQQLLSRHGYNDACIYGHAFEGNYHFIINQSFRSDADVRRYASLMSDLEHLVVDKYDGSLKAEHGTGRNMAPFVRLEWGDKAYGIMKEVKEIFDPEGILNPGVIFSDDPECHLKNFKPLPLIENDPLPEQATAHDSRRPQDKHEVLSKVDKCIECGFCEVNCLSCGLTLSSRQRIVIQREIARLSRTGENPDRLRTLRRQYLYPGNQTCAGDGLCSTSCPMGINVGELTHILRHDALGRTSYALGNAAADHFPATKSAVRSVLSLAGAARSVLGAPAVTSIGKALHKVGLPLWTPSLPRPYRPSSLPSESPNDLAVVYFPSCINQTMGLSKGSPAAKPLVNEMTELLHKAGYRVIFPEGMERLCCGTIWESKGMADIAGRKVRELEDALWEASEQGRYPVLCDQSPCLHRMRKCISKMRLYEPAEFIFTFLRDRLVFTRDSTPVAVHITCSMREMGLGGIIKALAELCSEHVLIPEEVGCCGFAGDRGFTHPEVNAYALRKLKPQIEAHSIPVGYSNSRTCEIGLTTNSGIPYLSIAYLVNSHTKAAPLSKL